jgi:hypothetical protein
MVAVNATAGNIDVTYTGKKGAPGALCYQTSRRHHDVYQEPKLCKVYVEEYRWQRRKEVERRTGLAKRELSVAKAFRRYLLGEFRSQDDLVDYIHEFSGAHKHVIRRLILAMFEDQRKIQVLSEKRRLTANEMKVLKRGLRNGYIKPVD